MRIECDGEAEEGWLVGVWLMARRIPDTSQRQCHKSILCDQSSSYISRRIGSDLEKKTATSGKKRRHIEASLVLRWFCFGWEEKRRHIGSQPTLRAADLLIEEDLLCQYAQRLDPGFFCTISQYLYRIRMCNMFCGDCRSILSACEATRGGPTKVCASVHEGGWRRMWRRVRFWWICAVVFYAVVIPYEWFLISDNGIFPLFYF